MKRLCIPRFTIYVINFLIIFLTIQCTSHNIPSPGVLKIGAVQFEVEQSVYTSKKSFEKKISGIIRESVSAFNPDLIIFPEYTLVFLALIPYNQQIIGSSDSEEAFIKIKKNHPEIESIHDIFLNKASYVKKFSDEVFGSLSKKYNLYILAGTYFAQDSTISKKTGLFNRAIVYDPTGNPFYTQDKVFLTDFEENAIGLSSGNMDHATGFSIREWDIGITICRDAYLIGWETHYSGKDLWIDIKANGDYFTEQQKASFKRALPLRIMDTDVPYGITLCLTGSFFELFWEGESSLIKKNSSHIEYLKRSKTVNEEEILLFSLNP